MAGQGVYQDVVIDPQAGTVAYRSGLAVYQEALIKGRFVARGWNITGEIAKGGFDPRWNPVPQAFWLEVDGQLLASHWDWAGAESSEEGGGVHAVITLTHRVRPVTVRVHTKTDGTAIFTRWLEITNTGSQPAALAAAFPWSGTLQMTGNWRSHLSESDSPLYSLGVMARTRHMQEGDFQWFPLPSGMYTVDSRYRRNRHRHPMFVLRNHATGQHFICQLAWSGGYAFEFDLDDETETARLSFRVGPHAPPPLRVLAPGETVTTPEVHLGMVQGGLDDAVNEMHTHLRRSVFLPQPRGRGGWVEVTMGIAEDVITLETARKHIEVAKELGGEVFFIDAGWYSPPGTKWETTLGDWKADPKTFPDGIKAIRDLVHEHGMLWGLWMDPEHIHQESETGIRHVDWMAASYDGGRPYGNILDLTRPDVAQWLEDQICRVIEEYECDFFRLDCNFDYMQALTQSEQQGFVENTYWRYYDAFYAIFDRVRERFPGVILENCAAGGGRTDIGLMKRFSHTWVTDWMAPPRAFRISNGMTMALPPEYIDRLVGIKEADLDFQIRLALFGRPTIVPVWSPETKAKMKHMVDLYKGFVRPFITESRIYHHTPTLSSPEPQGWGVLEMTSADRQKGIAGLFQLSAPQEPEYLFRSRGLDLSKRYRVTWDSTGEQCVLDGFEITKRGIPVRLEGALTSELLLFEALDQ